ASCANGGLLPHLRRPRAGGMPRSKRAFAAGATVAEICAPTGIDLWLVQQRAEIQRVATEIEAAPELTAGELRVAKRYGLSDAQIGQLRGMHEQVVRGVRHALGVRPVFTSVDSCAGEFAARASDHYSSYVDESEV